MKILDNYIGQSVLRQTVTVMVVLLFMYTFMTVIDELKLLGRGQYTLWSVVRYCLMIMPRQAYELFPMVALLGGILGLGALATSNELTVIRAAGVSVRRILLAVVKMALVMMVVVSVVGEVIAPALEQQARTLKAQDLNRDIGVNTAEGFWARDGDTYVHIRRLLSGNLAGEVTLYLFDAEHRLQQTFTAVSASYGNGEWILSDVSHNLLTEDQVVSERLEQYHWNSVLTPMVLNTAAVPPDKLAIADLAGYVRFTRENGLDARIYELSLWTRIATPFATGGMLLLAVPFIFGTLRSVGAGLRITVGALVGISFYLFNLMFGRIALVYDLPPVASAILPTLVVYGLWWALMRRVQ